MDDPLHRNIKVPRHDDVTGGHAQSGPMGLIPENLAQICAVVAQPLRPLWLGQEENVTILQARMLTPRRDNAVMARTQTGPARQRLALAALVSVVMVMTMLIMTDA